MMKKLDDFSSRLGKMLTQNSKPTLRKVNIYYSDWKGGIKLSLFEDDIIIFVENPKGPTIELPELLDEYS